MGQDARETLEAEFSEGYAGVHARTMDVVPRRNADVDVRVPWAPMLAPRFGVVVPRHDG